jgi:tripartite-type tricarboxylate transporter receptor subunit TctC
MFTMKRKTLFLLVGFFFLASLFCPKEPLAAPYYTGKRVALIVTNEPGAGYDRTARLLVKYLPKYIPGNPTIIVENMVGASGLVGTNYLYNIAKPDGLTIGAMSKGNPIAQLLKAEGVRFDMRKFAWIGSLASEATLFVVRNGLPYKTFNELRKAKDPIFFGTTGPASLGDQFTSLSEAFLGLKIKRVVTGSSGATALALERSEADAMSGSYGSLLPFIRRIQLRPMIRGRVSEAGVENLPVDEDLATDKDGKTIMAIRSSTDLIGRPYVAPPGTPSEIVNIWREAFAKAAKDPNLQKDAKTGDLTVEYLPAGECVKVLNNVFSQPPDLVNKLGKYIKF